MQQLRASTGLWRMARCLCAPHALNPLAWCTVVDLIAIALAWMHAHMRMRVCMRAACVRARRLMRSWAFWCAAGQSCRAELWCCQVETKNSKFRGFYLTWHCNYSQKLYKICLIKFLRGYMIFWKICVLLDFACVFSLVFFKVLIFLESSLFGWCIFCNLDFC